MQINAIKPVYGQTYDLGWIGFVRGFGFVSDAIEYGERAQRGGAMPSVTHALMVTGEGQCVEALLASGVTQAPLSKYFDDPRQRIYFRKPNPIDPQIALRLAATALSKVGDKYDDLLIAEEAAADTILGRLINRIFKNWPHYLLSSWLARKNEFFCSYLDAYAMNAQPEYKGRGILSEPLSGISPQQLFDDGELFSPFVNDCSLQQG